MSKSVKKNMNITFILLIFYCYQLVSTLDNSKKKDFGGRNYVLQCFKDVCENVEGVYVFYEKQWKMYS